MVRIALPRSRSLGRVGLRSSYEHEDANLVVTCPSGHNGWWGVRSKNSLMSSNTRLSAKNISSSLPFLHTGPSMREARLSLGVEQAPTCKEES